MVTRQQVRDTGEGYKVVTARVAAATERRAQRSDGGLGGTDGIVRLCCGDSC